MKTIFAFQPPLRACALGLAIVAAGQAGAAGPVMPAPAQTGTPMAGESAQAPAAQQQQPQQQQQQLRATLSIGGDTLEAVDLDQLEHERGRADTVLNDTKLNGDVANNSATNVQTGANTIDAGSFANMSGIPVVIQNSGANVLIQNATVINLQFQ
jgi:hypothetical protein